MLWSPWLCKPRKLERVRRNVWEDTTYERANAWITSWAKLHSFTEKWILSFMMWDFRIHVDASIQQFHPNLWFILHAHAKKKGAQASQPSLQPKQLELLTEADPWTNSGTARTSRFIFHLHAFRSIACIWYSFRESAETRDLICNSSIHSFKHLSFLPAPISLKLAKPVH